MEKVSIAKLDPIYPRVARYKAFQLSQRQGSIEVLLGKMRQDWNNRFT
jgi:hypothetical protein